MDLILRTPYRPAALPHQKALQKRSLDHPQSDQNPLAQRAATTEGVQLGPLTDEQIARAKHHRTRLLLRRLWLDKSHGRAAGRLRDGFRIRSIVLFVVLRRASRTQAAQALH